VPRDNTGRPTTEGLASLAYVLQSFGRRLRKAANRNSATILISVDQAEEMIHTEGKSAQALADYLRVALNDGQSYWQLAFTVRSDSFPELQSHRLFEGLEAVMLDLRALPGFRFSDVVEKPSRRYGVNVEPQLVERLVSDAPNSDSLPLLAFALERLWQQFGDSGKLTSYQYNQLGGLQRLIEDSAERAMRGIEPGDDVPVSNKEPSRPQTDLAEATFIPALVDINEKGEIIGYPARWSQFREEQRELLGRFNRWRLVVRRGEAEGGTVEVAHEALFRTWDRLASWLQPERARLEALRSLKNDAELWERNETSELFLNHRGQRLKDIELLSLDSRYKARIGDLEKRYLSACITLHLKNSDLSEIRVLKTNLNIPDFPFSIIMIGTFVFSACYAWYTHAS
jgi:hypothetical protein